jgi:hypothetical protein
MLDIDNAGGIILAEYVFPADILTMFYLNDGVYIVLNLGRKWKKLPNSKDKISVEAIPTNDDAGTIYETKVSITCPFNRVTSDDKIYFELLKEAGMILRYTLTSGDKMIAGQNFNPLRGTVRRLTPAKMNDFSGYQLDFSAKTTVGLMSYLY